MENSLGTGSYSTFRISIGQGEQMFLDSKIRLWELQIWSTKFFSNPPFHFFETQNTIDYSKNLDALIF